MSRRRLSDVNIPKYSFLFSAAAAAATATSTMNISQSSSQPIHLYTCLLGERARARPESRNRCVPASQEYAQSVGRHGRVFFIFIFFSCCYFLFCDFFKFIFYIYFFKFIGAKYASAVAVAVLLFDGRPLMSGASEIPSLRSKKIKKIKKSPSTRREN